MTKTTKAKLKAFLASKTFDAGEETGECRTCADFEFTGFSIETLNKLIDEFDEVAIQ